MAESPEKTVVDTLSKNGFDVSEKKRTKPSDKPVELTVETAKALLELKVKQRAEACSAELEKILAKYNCQLSGAFVCDTSGPRVMINVVALQEK